MPMIPDWTINGCQWTYWSPDGQGAVPCVQHGTRTMINRSMKNIHLTVCRWHAAVARRNGYHDE